MQSISDVAPVERVTPLDVIEEATKQFARPRQGLVTCSPALFMFLLAARYVLRPIVQSVDNLALPRDIIIIQSPIAVVIDTFIY